MTGPELFDPYTIPDMPNVNYAADPEELKRAKYLGLIRMGLGVAGREPLGSAAGAGINTTFKGQAVAMATAKAQAEQAKAAYEMRKEYQKDLGALALRKGIDVEGLRKAGVPANVIIGLLTAPDTHAFFTANIKPYIEPRKLGPGDVEFIGDQAVRQVPTLEGNKIGFLGGEPMGAVGVPGVAEQKARIAGMEQAAKGINIVGTFKGPYGEETGYPPDILGVLPPAMRGTEGLNFGNGPQPAAPPPAPPPSVAPGVPPPAPVAPAAPVAPPVNKTQVAAQNAIATMDQQINEEKALLASAVTSGDKDQIRRHEDNLRQIQSEKTRWTKIAERSSKPGVLVGQDPMEVTRTQQGSATLLDMSKTIFEEHRKHFVAANEMDKHTANLEALDQKGIFSGAPGWVSTEVGKIWNQMPFVPDFLKVDPQKLANTEVAQTEISKMQQALGKAFPGQQSNYELQVVTNALPQLMGTPQGRAKVYQVIRQAAEYERKNYLNMSDHAARSGGDLTGWTPLPVPNSTIDPNSIPGAPIRETGGPITTGVSTATTKAFPKGPPIGTVISGRRYKGGDPNSKASWE